MKKKRPDTELPNPSVVMLLAGLSLLLIFITFSETSNQADNIIKESMNTEKVEDVKKS